MGELKKFTAKDARALTNESIFMQKSIYKWIEETAKRNNSKLILSSDEFDRDMFLEFLAQLKNEGYKITTGNGIDEHEIAENEKADFYIINW